MDKTRRSVNFLYIMIYQPKFYTQYHTLTQLIYIPHFYTNIYFKLHTNIICS